MTAMTAMKRGPSSEKLLAKRRKKLLPGHRLAHEMFAYFWPRVSRRNFRLFIIVAKGYGSSSIYLVRYPQYGTLLNVLRRVVG
jgi:hypothetical protein